MFKKLLCVAVLPVLQKKKKLREKVFEQFGCVQQFD
nr:MAG TPA: hypothetical protein [Caudoviricetes sp.]